MTLDNNLLFTAFYIELFLYDLWEGFASLWLIENSWVLQHLIVIYISSHKPFCSRPFFIPHWSASTDLSVITRAFCFWFLMDCASTHECTASNTSKCLTRQIFTESIIKWENGYPATPEGLRYHSLCTRTFDSNRSELCIREWHDAFAPQVKGPQKFLTKSEIAASRRRSTGPNEVLQKYCNSYYFIFNWICCIVERKYVFNLLKSEKNTTYYQS